MSPPSLGPQSPVGALALAVVAPPQAVELSEVHVGRDPARLVGLSRLAPPLPEQPPVPRGGAGALRLRVGGLEGGRGALAAGGRGGGEENGGEREFDYGRQEVDGGAVSTTGEERTEERKQGRETRAVNQTPPPSLFECMNVKYLPKEEATFYYIITCQ